MPVRLSIGDAVLVQIDKDQQLVGSIKYIGPLVDNMMIEYVGIELVEPISNGHDGTINGFTYFAAAEGYGYHCKPTNIIKKLLPSELVCELREQFQYIQKLKSMLNTNKSTLNIPQRQSVYSNITVMTDSKIQSIPPTPWPTNDGIRTRSSTMTTNRLSVISSSHSDIQSRQSIIKIPRNNSIKNRSSIMSANSSSISNIDFSVDTDDTDHEFSSSYSYSDVQLNAVVTNQSKTKIKKRNKSKTINNDESKQKFGNKQIKPLSRLCTNVSTNRYPKMPVKLKQSHSKLFGGNIDVLYIPKSINANVSYSSYPKLNGYVIYTNDNQYNLQNFSSCSSTSPSPKFNSLSPK